MIYLDTVTLYNRKENRGGDTWYPTVLRNVHLMSDRAALIAKYGPETQDNAALNVRCKIVGDEVWVGSKQWLPPKRWMADEDYDNTITFTDGSRFDFFVEGEFHDIVNDADYTGGFYAYMNKTFDHVYAITAVGGPYKLIPHFEIKGK